MSITLEEVRKRMSAICHQASNDLCSGLDRIALARLSHLYDLIYPLYLDISVTLEKQKEEEMKDKDQQSEEFEHDLTLAKLRGLKEDIDASVDHARSIADTHIQRGTGGRELSLAITNMQQGRQWVEEALREIEK